MNTVADSLRDLELHLPHALVSAAGRERLRVAAAMLPAVLSRCLYVECRAGGDGTADLIADVDVDGAGVLAGTNPVIGLSNAQRVDPHWAPIIALAREWGRPGGALHAAIADAWLEFDLGGSDAPSGRPSLFVDFDAATAHGDDPARRLEIVRAVLDAAGVAISAAAVARLETAIAAIPRGASLLYMGLMLSRRSDAVRLCIMGMTPRTLARYVADVGWPGDLERLGAIVDAVATEGGQAQPAIVHVDVGATIAGTLGLEYPLARAPQLRGEIAEQPFLEWLQRERLISPAERAALPGWLGREERTRAHELWPSVIVRRVNHVKVVLHPDADPVAKLYLCAESTPRIELRPPGGG